jgi:hypothetical protein
MLVSGGTNDHTLTMARSRSLNDIFDPLRHLGREAERLCDHPGCAGKGEYRAPKSRAALRDYYWFCLDHVQSYNKAWNYYADMNSDEIEAQIRFDTVWQRPTWPLGGRGPQYYRQTVEDVDDVFDVFREERRRHAEERRTRPTTRKMTEEEAALATLDLTPPVSFAQVKARYKELAKKLHPDANGGDRDAEERLKVVNEAYSKLKNNY